MVITETDDETVVTEFGGSDTFTMALAEQPAAPILIRHNFLDDIIIIPQDVTFTPENWDVPQTLTVYAENDYLSGNSTVSSILYTAETVVDGIYDYGYLMPSLSVSVQDTPKAIPSNPLVVTTLVDSVSEEIEGSLRQMIQIANARAGADTITFQAGLTGTIQLASDLPFIKQELTIIGSGQNQLTINGGGIYDGFITDGFNNARITLATMTLTNLLSAASGKVELTDVTVTDSGHGASFTWGYAAVSGSVVKLNRVTMHDNSGVYGGAVGADSIQVADSTFTNNQTFEVTLSDGVKSFGGGALFISGYGITRGSTFIGNSAPYGGAIYNGFFEDAIPNHSFNFVFDSLFHENSADEGGAIFTDYGSSNISRSLFTANQAIDGGAIAAKDGYSAQNFITNSTFNGNLNTSPTGAAAVAGGADIVLSTFSGHHTNASNSAGVIRSGPLGSVILFGVIIAHNNETTPLECSGFIVGDNNLTNDTTCSGHFAVPTGIDPVLRDNGGFTQTHALFAGSNAIDADRVFIGDPDGTTGCVYLENYLEVLGDVVDQRGTPRPFGDACDLGAFEFDTVVTVVNLLANGSFEAASSHPKLNRWLGENLLTSDKRLCQSSQPSLITADGECVFQFKANGTPTSARSLKQVVTGGDLGGAGETLTLSAMVEGHKFKTGAQLVVTVTYANNTTAKKNIAIPNGTYSFQEITGKLKLTKKVKKIVVNINVSKVTGRLRVDEVWLSLSDTALHDFPVDGTRDGAILELPEVPDGFRR